MHGQTYGAMCARAAAIGAEAVNVAAAGPEHACACTRWSPLNTPLPPSVYTSLSCGVSLLSALLRNWLGHSCRFDDGAVATRLHARCWEVELTCVHACGVAHCLQFVYSCAILSVEQNGRAVNRG
eukprot:353991-Chlamydomonas_euryale.AAC.8